MEIIHYKSPFYHTIIRDFYTEEEQIMMWQEIDFLNQPGKLLPPKYTGDPDASQNKLGLFLDDFYGKNRQISNILTINRKIFNIFDFKNNENPFLNYLSICDKDETMISYYSNNSYYKSHYDMFVLSSVTLFHRFPKKFSGGNLMFNEYGYIPDIKHNSMIIFPSFERHSVSRIKVEEDNYKDGRYTINQFFTFRPHNINN